MLASQIFALQLAYANCHTFRGVIPMMNKRLVNTVPESKKYIAANVAFQWLGLLANIAVMTAIAAFLQALGRCPRPGCLPPPPLSWRGWGFGLAAPWQLLPWATGAAGR